jgi:hypothetical protein
LVNPLKGGAEVGPGRFHHQVIVVVHQHVGMDQNSELFDCPAHQLQEMAAIPVVPVNRAPFIAATADVIPAVDQVDAYRSRQDAGQTTRSRADASTTI